MDYNHFCGINFVIWNKQTSRGGKKIGKMVGEYNKAKTEMQNQINDMTKAEPNNLTIDGPVQTERQKLEKMAQTMRIDTENKTDVELKNAIDAKFGPKEDSSENKFRN